jgi:prepilin-type N-terminal cleavage/methylation domain-containing protein
MSTIIKKAFTLIELLVVIAIIGILSGLIVVTMNGITSKANIAKGQVFSNSLRNALMLNLVSDWKLDENTGQYANDSWSGNNTGTLGNSTGVDSYDPTWSTDCVRGSCLFFNGTGNYANFGNASNLRITSQISIEAWVYMNSSASSSAKIVNKGRDGYSAGDYDLSGSVFSLYVDSLGYPSGYKATSYTMSAVKWHHVVATYDGDRMKVYVDGIVSSNTQIGLHTIDVYASAGRNLWIGSNNRGNVQTSDWWNGKIDEVKIYNQGVPASQIKQNYYSGVNSLLSSHLISENEYAERLKEINISLN